MKEHPSTESDFDTLTALEADAYARGLLHSARGRPMNHDDDLTWLGFEDEEEEERAA